MLESIVVFLKKHWLRFVIVILAVLFFLLAHQYFVINLEKDGRPIDEQINTLIVTNPNGYRFNVEALSRYDERNYIHNLGGWAFSVENTNQSASQIETIIVLVSNKNEFYFETVDIERPDVVEAFPDLDTEILEAGFSALINQQLLPPDEYCIGILLKNATTSTNQVINTGRALLRKGRSLELIEGNNNICDSVFIEYEPTIETIRLPEISEQIKYYVDGLPQVTDQEGMYQLIGWAFSTIENNQPTNNFTTNIVVFNETDSFLFEAISTSREDVVQAFEDLNLDIVVPGYQITIAEDQLEDGDYCIGILLTDKQNSLEDQFIITNKVISKKGSLLDLLGEKELFCQDLYLKNVNSDQN